MQDRTRTGDCSNRFHESYRLGIKKREEWTMETDIESESKLSSLS